MNAENLHYYIQNKIRRKGPPPPDESTLLKEKLHDYKRQDRQFKQSSFLRQPATGIQEIVRVRGETEELQKSLTLLQRGVRGIEQYRETLRHIITCLQSPWKDTSSPESIRTLLQELDQTAREVEEGLLSQAYVPQQRTQHVLVRERGSSPDHPMETIRAASERFDTIRTYTLKECFGRDRAGTILDVIKVDSVRTVRNFFTAGGLEETRETFSLDENRSFGLQRSPKPGSEIVVLDSRVLPHAKTESPTIPSYTLEDNTLILLGLDAERNQGRITIEFWTDTSLDRFHLTRPTIPCDPITAVTVKNRPVPKNAANGYSLENNVIILHGTWIPEEGDDVQVTFNTGIQVRHLDMRVEQPGNTMEVEINGTLLDRDQFTVQNRRLTFPHSVQPQHGDLVILRESMNPDVSVLELSRKPLPGSVQAVLHSPQHGARQLPVSHTERKVLLREAVRLNQNDNIAISYMISESVRHLELQHTPVPATVSVTMLPEKTQLGQKRIKGLPVRGATVVLSDFIATDLPGAFLVSYQWKDMPARLQKPELPLTHPGHLEVPLDKPLTNPDKLSITVKNTAVPRHRLNGYRINGNTVILSGIHVPNPGDEITLNYEFGQAVPPVYAGTRIFMGKEAELPIDLSLTGVNLDTLELHSPEDRKRSLLSLKWLSNWLLQKETKIQTQLSRAGMSLSGLLRRQEALSKRTFRATSYNRQQPEVIEQTCQALSEKNRKFLGKIASLKPFSAGVLLDEGSSPWSAMLHEKQTISAYC